MSRTVVDDSPVALVRSGSVRKASTAAARPRAASAETRNQVAVRRTRGLTQPGVPPDSRVQMVVVVPQHAHDAPRAGEPGVGADVDELHTRGDEAVDEILREAPVDLRDERRRPLLAVAPGVVDVDVASVLVCHVHRAERAASSEADVADADPRGRRVGLRVLTDDSQDDAKKPVGTPAPFTAVGHAVQDGIPREEVLALGGELDATHQTAVGRRPDRNGPPPGDLGLGRRRLPHMRLAGPRIREGGCARGGGESKHQRGEGDSHEQDDYDARSWPGPGPRPYPVPYRLS